MSFCRMVGLFGMLAFGCRVYGQAAGESLFPNIVPNPGFELYAASPIGWFYKGEHFTSVMKYWNSATAASPDVYGPRVRVPESWANNGFGKQKPHGGSSMAGITLYGCVNGKPHCREYIEVQLNEPLVVGQAYSVELWLSHLPRSLQINNIGLYFSEEKVSNKLTEGQLDLRPQVNAQRIISAPNNKWVRMMAQFTAETEAGYLVIGNFFSDDETKAKAATADPLNFAYYYVDDVAVRKIKPILPVPVKDDDLTRQSLEEGKAITLKNLFFEFDKDELLPRSYVELSKLLQILRDNPQMKVEIGGHTDNTGSSEYNASLSAKRALAVTRYLYARGIAKNRVAWKGYGSTRPVAGNDTEAGRQRNRRVEMLILQL